MQQAVFFVLKIALVSCIKMFSLPVANNKRKTKTADHKMQKAKDVTERINAESEKITSAQNEKTAVLDKIFEEKHTQWEKEIFDNIISPK